MEETIMMSEEAFAPAKLLVIGPDEEIREYPVQSRMLLGRPSGSVQVDVVLEDKAASRSHGELLCNDQYYYYRDLGSRNGTRINGVLYGGANPANTGKYLEHGDVLRIGHCVLLFWRRYLPVSFWQLQPLSEGIGELKVGRRVKGAQGICLTNEFISRDHASFFYARDGWAIADHNSKNGVFLNNQRLQEPAYLKRYDVVRIADTPFLFMGDHLIYPVAQSTSDWLSYRQDLQAGQRRPAGEQLMIHIEERSVWQRFRKLTLLQNIDVTINSGELVLILGGSGAGKTTFMNAVMGYEKAKGTIRHGDRNIYTDYAEMKYEIGFVPQQDLLRGSDTVYETLKNAAKMKLPMEISAAERENRIEDVLELLGLQRESFSLVSKLSGGQRKRLSIAVEYVADPSLFFLDEPDSGLDGIMARSLMQNLRSIADRGKIVMVITHGPDRAAELFDKVIVLAKSAQDNSGHLTFFGTVPEACRFFETNSLEGVVRRVNRPDEGGDGLADYYIERFQRERK